jgi:hypothetical protein
MRWVEEWTKAQVWGCPCHPKKYPRGTSIKAWGCPPRHLFFIGKNQVTFQHTIFLLLHALCIFLGVSVVFSFQFCLVLFFCNKWLDPNKFLLEKLPCLSFAKNTPFFYSYRFNECSLFLELRLVFLFHLDFYSDLAISFYQGIFWPLVHVGFHQKSCFKKKIRMVLEKRKSFMQKIGTKRSLCRLRPRLLHVVLDVFLIVYLVVLL